MATEETGEALARLSAQAEGDALAKADALRSAEALIAAYAAAPDPDLAARRTDGRLRVLHARLLALLDHDAEARDELVELCDTLDDPAVQAEALALRVRVHRWLGEDDAAKGALAELVAQSGAARDPEVRAALADARDFRLGWLVGTAQSEDDTALLHWWSVVSAAEELVANHRGEPGLPTRACVQRGLLWWARALREVADRVDDAGDEAERLRAAAGGVADEMFATYSSSADEDERSRLMASESDADRATEDPAETLRLTDRGLALAEPWGGEPEEFFAGAARHRVWALRQLASADEVVEAARALIARHGASEQPAVRDQVAGAWADRVGALLDEGEAEAALAAAAEFDEWLGEAPLPADRPDFRHSAARVLTLRVRVLARRLPPKRDVPDGRDGLQAGEHQAMASEQLSPEAAAYADAVGELAWRLAADPDPALRAVAASRLAELGDDLRVRGHLEASEDAYRTLIAALRDDPHPDVAAPVSRAMINLGFQLFAMADRSADAVVVYDDFLARFGNETSAEMRERLAKVHSSRQAAVGVLYTRGLTVEGLEPDDLGEEAREQIRITLRAAREASDAGRDDEAIAGFDEVIAAYPSPRGADLRMRVCDAMVRKGYCLNRQRRYLDSVRHHNEFLAEFGTDVMMTIEKDVALGLSNRGVALDGLGRLAEASDSYGEILRRWGSSTVPYLVHRCANAAWNQAHNEAQLGHDEAAERGYRVGLGYLRDEATRTRVEGAKGGVFLAIFLRDRNRLAEAVEVADQVVAALADVSDPAARKQLGYARIARARTHVLLGDRDSAWTDFDWCLNSGLYPMAAESRAAVEQEFIQAMGGPFKGAWLRMKRSWGKKG